MNESTVGTIIAAVKVIILVVCVALVIIGQRTISFPSLMMQLAGLVGILILLFLYNRKYQ